MAMGFQRKSFTFTWRIANYDVYFQYSAYQCSPWFVVDTLKGSRWRIGMIPDLTKNGDDAIGLRFESDALCCPYENIDLNYRFSLSSDHFSSSPVEVSALYTFRGGSASPCQKIKFLSKRLANLFCRTP
ncbi:hypothetical protein AVEN_205313-1 [Araneus ventricosus]|uniref:MATH domain-containing protein n=1 Tax=Araneus ventricosus TaxID=182803 RepID=A0A4Y2K611_ARAVE|nr:hypothetical protein AVEN_205313-1 [Araneus ventricosus]